MVNKKKLNENIISALGIEALPDNQKIALLEKMSDLAQKRIVLRILEQLNDTEQEVFIDATTNNEEAKIKDILDSKKIDINKYTEEEVLKLKEEMKGVVGKLEM